MAEVEQQRQFVKEYNDGLLRREAEDVVPPEAMQKVKETDTKKVSSTNRQRFLSNIALFDQLKL